MIAAWRADATQFSSNAFQSQHPFGLKSTTAHDHEDLVTTATEEAAQHPNRHRMAVLPSRANSSVEVIDVWFTRIRERQDKSAHG